MPTTPNMGMVLPDVSTTPGPTWASNLNTALNDKVDTHDHTSSKGVKVPSAGLNINADLEMNSNDLTETRTAAFDNQGAPISGSETRAVYVASGELYFNDNSGNQVKITNAGAVNVSGSNGIGGDYGGANPASVFYTDSTELYSFTTDPGVFGNLKLRGLEKTGKLLLNPHNLAGNLTVTTGASDPYHVILVDTTAARTITLPNAATEKRIIVIRDKSGQSESNNITLDRSAGGNIEGVAANYTLSAAHGVWELASDGTDWWFIRNSNQVDFIHTLTTTQLTATTSPAVMAVSSTSTSKGSTITRSGNTFSFTKRGTYIVSVSVSIAGVSASDSLADLVIDFYDNSAASVLNSDQISVSNTRSTSGSLYDGHAEATFPVNVVSTANNYSVRLSAVVRFNGSGFGSITVGLATGVFGNNAHSIKIWRAGTLVA